VFLYELVHVPRCTTRMDSRTACNGNGDNQRQQQQQQQQQQQERSIESLLGNDNHFTNRTVNVVVLGAGPVGLALANLLGQLNQRQRRRRLKQQQQEQEPNSRESAAAQPRPEFRVVVFENRAESEGRKEPYSRTWITSLSASTLKGMIDPRVTNVLQAFYENDREQFWPVNFHETLLLLSNRLMNGGGDVKFVFAKRIEPYHEYLFDVPNLVVFDATGHRLDELNRDSGNGNGEKMREDDDDDDSTATTSVRKWNELVADDAIKDDFLDRWRFPREWMEEDEANENGQDGTYGHGGTTAATKHANSTTVNHPRNKSNGTLLIARRHDNVSGTLLYPVIDGYGSDGSNHKAYFLYRFDLCNLPNDREALHRIQAIIKSVDSDFRKEVGVPPPYQGGRMTLYDDTKYYRSDILEVLDRKSAPFMGFDFRGLSFKPTREQGRYLEGVLRRYGRPGEANMPLSRIPVQVIRDAPSFLDENRVREALLIAMTLEGTGAAANDHRYDGAVVNPVGIWVNAYRSRPYMYDNPAVPSGYSLTASGTRRRTVPLLRVGNSLLSGDTDIASGLATQLKILHQFFCLQLLRSGDGDWDGVKFPPSAEPGEGGAYPRLDYCAKVGTLNTE